MKRKTKQISILIKQTIGRIDPNAQIILYGSRARGTERIDSDWDILILTDYPV
jgi:predicted nucleotidyltransferase